MTISLAGIGVQAEGTVTQPEDKEPKAQEDEG